MKWNQARVEQRHFPGALQSRLRSHDSHQAYSLTLMSKRQISISSRLFADTDTGLARNPTAERHTGSLMIPELNSLAVRSLISLFDEQQGLFGRRAEVPGTGHCRTEITARDSVIALLGLRRLAESGAKLDLDTIAIQNAIFRDTAWIGTAGDMGLLSWVTALGDSERLTQLFSDFDFDKVLDRCGDARARNTRGLAWFLAGIAHARAANPRTAFDLTDVAVETYHLLLDNQSEYGLFRSFGVARSIGDIGCKRFGTFEDQMYAIYALTAFARAFDIEEPLDSALMCANCVCGLQGGAGQWWFLYDTRRGSVASRYPVCSVHQAGIGPAALLALEEVTSQSFQAALWHGLSWICDNEMGIDLRRFDRNSNAIDRRAVSRLWETMCSYLRIPQNGVPNDLRICHEGCAADFGWILYAFGNFGLPETGMTSTIGSGKLHAETLHGSN